MDKRQFIDHMISQVRSLMPSSVLGSRMNLIYKYGNHKGYCPFHNDSRIGSFVVTDKKHIWKCFSCGAGGDNIKFVADYEGINYLESAFKLGLEFGVISNGEYEEYFEKKRYRKSDIQDIQRRYEELDKHKFENNKADNDVLDKVFRLFIKSCSLTELHKEHLMSVRGLSETEIEDGMYFTFPTRRKMAHFKMVLRDEVEKGVDILENIPGFFFDKEENQWKFTFHKGIGIGIKNAKGQVVGIQIRQDKKRDDTSPRYVWFSSSFAFNDEKFEFATSSGSPVDVVYPEVITNNSVFITEGRFKAQHIAKLKGSIAISVQGVCSWRGIMEELKHLNAFNPIIQNRYKGNGKPFKIYCVLSAFDADMNYKYQVFQQLRNMTNKLESEKVAVYYLNWNEEHGKGIDDIILNGHIDEIKRYDKQKWDKAYDNMLKVLVDTEPYAEMKDVPEEVLKKYFYQEMQEIIKNPLGRNVKSQKHMAKVQ